MKRVKHLWPIITDPENGVRAIIDGTRYKRGHRETRFLLYTQEEIRQDPTLRGRIDERKARAYAEQIIAKLQSGAWHHQPPKHRRQFCRSRASSKGKWRDLYIPQLKDHIVSHMVINAAMQAFMRGMHPHCCGSIPGRGIAHLNRTVKRWMRQDKACRYFVKVDIRRFFDNIERDRLMDVLRSKIGDPKALEIFREIIDSAPVPCPVGYYTSPWLANLYLEKLDWYVEQHLYKERRGERIKYVRHYLRYMDDILLIGTSKADLTKAIHAIQDFLQKERGLSIKPSWEIKTIGKHETADGEWKMKPGTYWCDIGGYKFCKDATILRDGIYLTTRRLAKNMKKRGYYTAHQSMALNSLIGWASHCDARRFIRDEIRPLVNINATRRNCYVEKKREQRSRQTGGARHDGEKSDRAPGIQVCPGDG